MNRYVYELRAWCVFSDDVGAFGGSDLGLRHDYSSDE